MLTGIAYTKYQVFVLGQAFLPEGFHNEAYAIHQWLQLNFVHNAWYQMRLGTTIVGSIASTGTGPIIRNSENKKL